MSGVRAYLDQYLSARSKLGNSNQVNGTFPRRSEQLRMSDGTVSQYDLTVAKRLKDGSRQTLDTLTRSGAPKEKIDAARKQYFAAEQLYGKINKDFKDQSTATNLAERAKDAVSFDFD